MFTRADKGNITVAMDKEDYKGKMNLLLTDTKIYVMVEKDPTRKIIESLKILLLRWKNKGFINDFIYNSLKATEGILPRAYGLSKIHKSGNPLRIIIFSIDTPLHKFAHFLHKILIKGYPSPNSSIKNSNDLIKKLRDISLNVDYEIFSLDVTSLFTNVPTDLILAREEMGLH